MQRIVLLQLQIINDVINMAIETDNEHIHSFIYEQIYHQHHHHHHHHHHYHDDDECDEK